MQLQTSSFTGSRASIFRPAIFTLVPSGRTAGSRHALIVESKRGLNFKPPGKVAKANYDRSANQETPASSAFTRRREVFVGRLAMSGFMAGVIGELLTGKGFLGQLSLETNLPPTAVNLLVAAIVGFNLLTALNPAGPTFSSENQADVRKRPQGPIQNPRINPVSNPQEFLGIDKGFGFTRKNELFVGRMAMLGFTAAIIGERLSGGKGPLAQIGLAAGQPLNTQYAGAAVFLWVGVFLVAAIGYGSTQDPRFLGETDGDKRIF